MIDFACKKFDLNEVIRCGFGLSKTEYLIFKLFLTNRNSFINTSDIKRKLKFDLSTVQRAVKKLYELNILERGQTNLSSGGYTFTYKLRSKSKVKEKILEVINSWNKRVEYEFDKW